MVFDLRLTEDVLPWPSNANMTFDLRPTEDVLSWPGNANMAFDLRPMEDVLPWPGNANMAFDLRPTEDVLPCAGRGTRNTELTRKVDGAYTLMCKLPNVRYKDFESVQGMLTRNDLPFPEARGRNGDAVGDRGYQKIKYVRKCGASRKDGCNATADVQ
ncbi:hypothetical protein Tco_0714409 [Tanacetum coccineum]